MIRIKHSTGNDYYGRGLVSYITVWNKLMGTKGGIRFYDGELKLVADFQLGEIKDETEIIAYPHNNRTELVEIAERHEAEIRSLITQAMSDNPGRVLFTIDLAGGEIKLLKREHFNRFTSLETPQDELFTFNNDDPTQGFPRLYLHEKNQRTSPTYGDVFRILTKASRYVFPAMSDGPTPDGKRFTYMLFNSHMNFEFKPDVPSLGGVFWPTKDSCEIPGNLKIDAFEQFLLDIGIDELVFRDGKIVSVGESKKTEEDDDGLGEEWDDADVPLFLLSDGSADKKEDVRDVIWKMIDEKGFFNIGDALDIGFEKVLGMVPISGKIIPAHMDFPGLVRKMCIYQGIFHILPLNDNVGQLSELLDLEPESYRICTDENYPRTSLSPSPE